MSTEEFAADRTAAGAPGGVLPATRWHRARRTTVETLTDPTFLRIARWSAISVWLITFAHECYVYGVPFDREGLILWIMFGLVAVTLGKRSALTVVIDWLPFAAVLIAYDYARGAADSLGMPTWWSPQLDVDRWLFGGTVPTVWLQEHFKYPTAQWWDVAVSIIYVSFFFLPYVTAGVLWLRSRLEFRRWALRFVTLSFLGFGLFALIPAAPPWAAAKCRAGEVADHPADPDCLGLHPIVGLHGGMLGRIDDPRPGAHAYIERISGKGWPKLHLGVAQSLLEKGQGIVDQVAAVPSLHAGGTLLLALFLWPRLGLWWKAVLLTYNAAMALALMYAAEHYFSDILAGWLCALLVSALFGRIERRRNAENAPDRLDGPTPQPTASRMEKPCPSTTPTPSST